MNEPLNVNELHPAAYAIIAALTADLVVLRRVYDLARELCLVNSDSAWDALSSALAQTALNKQHPGAALLAERDAARCIIRVARRAPNRPMMDALIAYDAIAQAGADLPTPPWTALLGAVQAVVRTWQALSRCEDEFLPEQPGACSEWPGALDESIAELELAMEEVTKGTIR